MNETISLTLEVAGSDLEDATIIRPVANDAELEMVHRLTHDCYVSKGYALPQPDRRLIHYGDFDHLPQTTTFVAMRQNELVGSSSMTLDGPWGLTVEKDFKQICDSLRYTGRSLAVVWRLVVKDSGHHSRHLVVALIHAAIDRAALLGANTTLFTVNPRHQSVHHRLMNTTVLSIHNCTNGLDNAPGVLLRCDYERLPPDWRKFCNSGHIGRAA